MKGLYGMMGLAVVCTGLAGWAALALAQPGLGKQTPNENPPADTIPLQVPDGPAVVPTSGQAPAPTPGVPQLPTPTPSAAPAQPVIGTATPAPVQPEVLRPSRASLQERTPAAAPVADSPAVDLSGPGQSPENPTGRQEPAISLEWIGPPVAKVGQPGDYTLAVRNACNIPVQQVMVRVRVPAGMNIAATEPKGLTEANVIMWELGTMQPKQEKNLQMRLVPDSKGDVGCQAWVTFTGASVMRIRVREPKLALRTTGPDKVLIGDAATFLLTVSNPGDGPAEMVKVRATLSDGLENLKGKVVDFDIGNLAPGETRSVQVICNTKAGGPQKCDSVAEADGGLKATDQAVVNVIMPRLDLEATGPKLRYLDRKAVYVFKVTNPGDASATNAVVSDVIPAGFKFLNASDGGRHDFSTRTVSWFLGEVGPGQTREVKLEVLAVNPGEHHHKVAAQAARGLHVDGDVMTRVEGLSAVLLEVVDIEDPVEVGADTAYEIRVTNTGSKTETDIKLLCTIPDKMEFKSAQGAAHYHVEGKVVVFEPIPKLAPRADAIFRVNVKAIAPGDVRFKTQITSTNLVEPVIEMEATRIYAD